MFLFFSCAQQESIEKQDQDHHLQVVHSMTYWKKKNMKLMEENGILKGQLQQLRRAAEDLIKFLEESE